MEEHKSKRVENSEVSNSKEQIIEIVNGIENENFLEFICNLLNSFKKKWGI